MDPGLLRDQKTFAIRVRTIRQMFGWSLRTLAEKARITVRTLDRIEKGEPCKIQTEDKLAAAFDIFTGRLWEAEFVSNGPVRVCRSQRSRWYFGERDDAETYQKRSVRMGAVEATERLRLDPDSIQDEAERLRLGRLGLSRVFVQVMNGVIDTGHYQVNVVECFGRDVRLPSPIDLTFCYFMLRGSIRLGIGDCEYELSEGDSITMDAGKGCTCEPLNLIGAEDLPPKFVLVRAGMLPLKVNKPRGRKSAE